MNGVALPNPPARRPKPGEEIEVAVGGIDARGGAVGQSGPERVGLARARPGSRVRARVLRRRRGGLEAYALEELDPGPWAAKARCVHAALCGGCSMQAVSYERQLAELRALLVRALEPLRAQGVEPERVVEPVIAAADIYGYRNKMDFTFASRRWIEVGEPLEADKGFALGLHLPGRHDKVLDIARCEIQFEQGNAILASARELARAAGLAPWDVRTHAGLLRHLVLRRSWTSGEILVYLVTADGEDAAIDAYAAGLIARHPEITTLVHGVSTRLAAVALGERERVLLGSGSMRERLGGLDFQISARSFFQVNTPQAERLVELVREEARCAAALDVYDLCCGAGLWGLVLAREARSVWSFELEPAAVLDARANAAANGIENARFVPGDLLQTLAPASLSQLGAPAPGLCVVDPPRGGLHPKVAQALATLAPARIVYVSCSPAAAARDLAPLLAVGYALERARPLDMFPHTPHVECVYSLARREGAAA